MQSSSPCDSCQITCRPRVPSPICGDVIPRQFGYFSCSVVSYTVTPVGSHPGVHSAKYGPTLGAICNRPRSPSPIASVCPPEPHRADSRSYQSGRRWPIPVAPQRRPLPVRGPISVWCLDGRRRQPLRREEKDAQHLLFSQLCFT